MVLSFRHLCVCVHIVQESVYEYVFCITLANTLINKYFFWIIYSRKIPISGARRFNRKTTAAKP